MCCLCCIIGGPTAVDPNMTFSLLSLRNSISITFGLSFTVSFGPPSLVHCNYRTTDDIITYFYYHRSHPSLSREVIRSQYINSSQPDMTRVTVEIVQPIREERIYTCWVTTEGRRNINYGNYDYDPKGSRHSTVCITGECCPCLH